MEEIEFSRWLFEGRPRQGKNVLPDGLNWLCYFAGSSKSHRENSISFILLESPHQVDMKNISPVSNIGSDNSQNVGLEDYNNISVGIFPHFTTPSIKISLG